jgi:hypothetical protein
MRLIVLICATLATIAVAAPPGIVDKRQDTYRCTLPGVQAEPGNTPYPARCWVYPASGAVTVLSFESNESNVSQIKRGLGKLNDPPV